MTGGLFDPLGTDRAERSRRRPGLVYLAALALFGLAVLLAVSFLRDDGDRGRPVAVAPIAHVEAPPKPPPAAPPPAAFPPVAPARDAAIPSGLPPVGADQDVEIQNGVRVVRPRGSTSEAGGRMLAVPSPPP